MTSQRHAGKVVLVTGGGSGIGRASALRFADEGAAAVYVVDHFGDRASSVAAELRESGVSAEGIVAELAELAGCHQAVDDVLAAAGHIDVVISNAAAWTEEPFLEMADESWLKVIAVNLTAYFRDRPARSSGDGRSGNGRCDPVHGVDLVARRPVPSSRTTPPTKAGVANLAKTMAHRARRPIGIRVNCVSPGPR